MMRTAWYIGCREDEVGEVALLVGDRARIERIAPHLEDARFLPENRGLRTVTGMRKGRRVSATAFGMGGPIAAIVLQELFDLGVKRFLRVGTAMAMPPAGLGDFVVAEGAVRGDGTSLTYAPLSFPAVSDFGLVAHLRAELSRRSVSWRAGLFGTYDGFYTEMYSLSGGQAQLVDDMRREIQRLRLVATDMETATLLVAGRVLGARVASMCLATVDGLTQEKLDAKTLGEREHEMFEIGLDAVVASIEKETP